MLPLISKNAVISRRLYLQNNINLIDFSKEHAIDRVVLNEGLESAEICSLAPDIVSEGTHGLSLLAGLDSDGKASHKMKFTYNFKEAVDMRNTPTLTFAFSAYGGERDSQYFSDLKENKYFVEKPDPLLISNSYLTLTLISDFGNVSSTVKLTDYGFNRVFMNFSGEEALGCVKAVSFYYEIFENAPMWQRIIKLDGMRAGMEVDFNLHGSGMEGLFSSRNAELLHKDGVLYASCKENGEIILPDLLRAENTVCDIFMPIKNTLLLRMDADVEDMDITVSFKTTEDIGSDNINVKTFNCNGLKEGNTLYLNLSDLKGAMGDCKENRRLVYMSLKFNKQCNVRIYKIAFEEEKRIRKTYASFVSSVADVENKTIDFVCKSSPEYAGGIIRIYDGYLDVIYDDIDTLSKLECIGCGVVDENGYAYIKAPLMRGKVTRVCSVFIGSLEYNSEYLPFENRTVIENHSDICEGNPYEFALPDIVYDVTSEMFGAYGDGYHDDTNAIQSALDLCAKTGGRVLLPSRDNDEYGTRYVVTNLRMHSNTELHIEKNAMIWQCDDATLYKTELRFGHNVSMTGVNWPANHSSGNMPLIYAFREENIKITGGGTVRMADIESRSVDGLFTYIGDNVCIGCNDRIHVVPIGLIECKNIEVSNVDVIRSSAPFMILNTSRNLYVGNVRLDKAKCTGADGLWPCGSDGVVFERVLMNTNDDGICLSANYNDPRDMLWYYAYPGWDHGTHNVTLRNSRLSCYTFTGSAISFCIWGTDAPDLSTVEVNGIELFDTVLDGRLSIGGWLDNPYYGVSPFDASETDDFSPVKSLRIRNCEFLSPTGIDNLRITDLDSDCGLNSPSQFEYGNFKRRVAERNEGWVTGLSNWCYNSKEAVRQIDLYGVPCASLRKIRNEYCALWQGLYVKEGKHVMRFKYKAGGEFIAFVKNKYGEDIATKSIYETPNGYSKGKDWIEECLEFEVSNDGLYRLGLECTDDTVVVYATDFYLE